MVNIADCESTTIFNTCHCKNKNNCLDVCKNYKCYYGDKIIQKDNDLGYKPCVDCIIENKNKKYIFIDFKDISVFEKKENIIENTKNKYEFCKKFFNLKVVEDMVIVFIDEPSKMIALNRLVISYQNKYNPLKLKTEQKRVLYKFCKTENKEISFKEYLLNIDNL